MGLCRALDKNKLLEYPIKQLERSKARMPAKLEHPLRVLQEAVRVCEGALSGAQHEQSAAHYVAYVMQSMDGKANLLTMVRLHA